MMRYKAVFIDVDDTLLDYIPCCREAFDAAMEALMAHDAWCMRVSDAQMDSLFELFFSIAGRLFSEAKHGLHTIAEVMDLYPAEFVEKATEAWHPSVAQQAEMTDVFKHAFRAAWGETHTLVAGSAELLQALHDKGYRLFAASNSFGHLQRRRLERAGILHYFEDTFISMDIGYDKPDIRFFEHALRQAGLMPADVLMVGDSMTTDVLGAQAAGMDTCWFNRRGEQPPAEAAGRMYVVASLPEILTFL